MITGRILINGCGRLNICYRELTCGDALKVLVLDKQGRPKWIDVTVEHNEVGYYLTGPCGYIYPLGLFAKIE